MGRFVLDRDINFFQSISRELVGRVIENVVVLYKLVIEESGTNLYGESLNKVYYRGVECTAVIDRDETSSQYEGFGSDTVQNVIFKFNRFILAEKGYYPEIGDVIYHNDAYFEIDNVREDQLIGGVTSNKFSIVCNTVMSRRTTIQTEERIV